MQHATPKFLRCHNFAAVYPRVVMRMLAITLAVALTASRAQAAYHLVQSIPVGGDGEWDYLEADTAGQFRPVPGQDRRPQNRRRPSRRGIRYHGAEGSDVKPS